MVNVGLQSVASGSGYLFGRAFVNIGHTNMISNGHVGTHEHICPTVLQQGRYEVCVAQAGFDSFLEVPDAASTREETILPLVDGIFYAVVVHARQST